MKDEDAIELNRQVYDDFLWVLDHNKYELEKLKLSHCNYFPSCDNCVLNKEPCVLLCEEFIKGM